ncbi:MAG: hypothetical protein KGI38_06590 [Thaumarchaeota archaeon]|nr:hypothetical protein [Nitrososphaerota archaeon]
MGWKLKLVLALASLASFGAGAWIVGVACVIALALTFRRGRVQSKLGDAKGLSPRFLLAGGLFMLAALAAASGGTYSPSAFLVGGSLVLAWPLIASSGAFAEAMAVEGSIALRSKYFPFTWYAVAELKTGPEDFARTAGSFSGELMVFTDSARAYALTRCFALRLGQAEAELLQTLRDAATDRRTGAYLLPLDSSQAASILRVRVSSTPLPRDLATQASNLSGLLVLSADGGMVDRASAYKLLGNKVAPSVPSGRSHPVRLLLWEVLDCVGKKVRWPEPDSYSNLLDSVMATRGERVSERFAEMEGSGATVKVQSLGGEKLELTRPQLRAIVSIYS